MNEALAQSLRRSVRALLMLAGGLLGFGAAAPHAHDWARPVPPPPPP